MPKECIYKNNASIDGGRYFFMEITKSNRIIINDIMYSLSIATTSLHGDDSITAQLLRLFRSYLLSDFPTKILYNIFDIISTFFTITPIYYNVCEHFIIFPCGC